MVRPELKILAAATIFSFIGPFIKWSGLSTPTVVFLRLAVPTLLILFILLRRGTVLWKHKRFVFFVSLINVVRLLLGFGSLEFTSIGSAWVVGYTWPVFAAVYSWLYLHERLGAREVGAIGLSLLGVIVVFSQFPFSLASRNIIGLTIMLASAMLYPVIVVSMKRYESRLTHWEMVFAMNILGAIILLPAIVPLPRPEQLGLGLAIGLGAGFIGFGLFYSALREIRASVASALANWELVGALTLSVLFFNEAVTWQLITGAVCIITSVLLLHGIPAPEG